MSSHGGARDNSGRKPSDKTRKSRDDLRRAQAKARQMFNLKRPAPPDNTANNTITPAPENTVSLPTASDQNTPVSSDSTLTISGGATITNLDVRSNQRSELETTAAVIQTDPAGSTDRVGNPDTTPKFPMRQYFTNKRNVLKAQIALGSGEVFDRIRRGKLWEHPPIPSAHIKYTGNLDCLYWKKIFYWQPDLTWGIKLPCTGCAKSFYTRRHEWPNSIYRLVMSDDDDFGIIHMRYVCDKTKKNIDGRGCGATFYSTDAALLCLLPEHIAHAFPAVLTRRNGISSQLLVAMRNLCESARIQTIHRQYYSRRKLKWDLQLASIYSALYTLKRSGSMHTFTQPIEDFDSEYGNCGTKYSTEWLDTVIMQDHDRVRADMDLRQQQVVGDILSHDHSHKFPKYIRMQKNRPFGALYTCINRQGQVVAQNLNMTKAQWEVQPILSGVARRLKDHSCKLKDFYTDDIGDEPMLLKTFPDLKDGISARAAAMGPCGRITATIPEDWHCQYIVDRSELDLHLTQIIIPALELNRVVPFDVEWDVDRTLGAHSKVQVFQFAIITPNSKTAYVVGVPRIALQNGDLPERFRAFLNLENIQWIGPNVSADLIKVNRDYELSIKGAVNLGRLLKEAGILPAPLTANTSLARMMDCVFDMYLPGKSDTRMSTWSDLDLSPTQVEYAAGDVVWVHMLLDYLKQFRKYDAVENVHLTGPVYVHNRSGRTSEVIAEGVMVDRNKLDFGWITHKKPNKKYQFRIEHRVVRVDQVHNRLGKLEHPAVIPDDLQPRIARKTLSDCGDTPSSLCKR